MKKGEIYAGEVRELAFPNKGIACVDGVDVVVKNTLPGQEISFILNKNKPGLKEGRLKEIIREADTETLPGCSVCRTCGGCVYQTIPYEEELKLKDKMARDILRKALKQHLDVFTETVCEQSGAGKPEQITLDQVYEGITGSPEIAGYRNKMEFSFGNEVKDGPITLGMHTPGHFMDVINTPDCNIVDADFRAVRAYVLSHARENDLSFYHRYSNTGFLRNLLIRKGIHTGEILVDIVTTSERSIDREELVRGIGGLKLEGTVVGILHTVNDGVADVVKDEGTEVFFGRDFLYDELLGLRFKISSFSFFQTNTNGAEILYTRAKEYIGSAVGSNAGVVYDLYSGTGTIAQVISGSAARVYGVEIVPEAVEAARINTGLNGIDNTEFICGDVLKVLDDIKEKPDLIILDPPRDGVNPKALRKILDYGVENILYISCKITSLARDLHPIIEAGYIPKRISVIDMFPRTTGMETICLLSNGVQN
ncbi:MAG: 23S rRNA (uracil(1939)-C(5))-methyltransferase RlmD [Lachnospiraceae bacterium]|nr:23S rRNA (uracil(1939)-C(5))-methyltransferase RlmD [Lachnospiraceae bacterium]